MFVTHFNTAAAACRASEAARSVFMKEPFEITTEVLHSGKIVLFSVRGSINVHTFDQVETAINQAFAGGAIDIIMVLSGVKYISSAGAGVLMNAYLQAQEKQGLLVLVQPTPGVRDVLDLLNLRDVLHSAPNVEAALTMLSESPRKAML